MNRISLIFFIYLLACTLFSFSAVLVPFSPGIEVASFLANDEGRFPIFAAVGLLLVILIAPMAVVLFLVNMVLSRKAKMKQDLLDHSSLTIKRQKILYNGIHGINIYINDKKHGSIMIGKPMQVGIPLGENTVYAEAMGQKTDVITVNLLDDLKQELLVGYDLIDGKQKLFIRKIEAPR